MAKLEKATITVLAGNNRNKVIDVLFNPAEYSFERSNSFKATPVPGLSSPLLQFVNGEADQLGMELFLDDHTDKLASQPGPSKKSVEDRIKELSALLDIDSSLHAPPLVCFAWGRLRFTGIIDKLSRKASLFQPDGTVSRAKLTVSFKEYRTLENQINAPRRESSDKSKRRVVIGQDSLWALAVREYEDATQWRLIAQANDLDDPREVAPGQWLILPPKR